MRLGFCNHSERCFLCGGHSPAANVSFVSACRSNCWKRHCLTHNGQNMSAEGAIALMINTTDSTMALPDAEIPAFVKT